MIFHENRLPADDSHETSSLICYFRKSAKFEIVVCCKLGGVYGLNLQMTKKHAKLRQHLKIYWRTLEDKQCDCMVAGSLTVVRMSYCS